MTATERHAIRHAIPALSALADDLSRFEMWDTADGVAECADEIRAVVKDLWRALDGETPSEAPTVPTESHESNRMTTQEPSE